MLHINAKNQLEQNKKNKIKMIRKRKQNYTKEQKKTSATSNNTIDTSKKGSRQKYNTSKLICYNCNKKGH